MKRKSFTDTQRLTWLLKYPRWGMHSDPLTCRRDVDKAMRASKRRAKP